MLAKKDEEESLTTGLTTDMTGLLHQPTSLHVTPLVPSPTIGTTEVLGDYPFLQGDPRLTRRVQSPIGLIVASCYGRVVGILLGNKYKVVY